MSELTGEQAPEPVEQDTAQDGVAVIEGEKVAAPAVVYTIDAGEDARPLSEVPSFKVDFYGVPLTFYMPTEEGLFAYLDSVEEVAAIQAEYDASKDSEIFTVMLRKQRTFANRFFAQTLTREDQHKLMDVLTNVRVRPTMGARMELVDTVVKHFTPLLVPEFQAMGMDVAKRFDKIAAAKDGRTSAEKKAGVSSERARRTRSR